MKYQFDQFILDKASRELSASNKIIKMEPKVFSLLLHLIENGERVVSKDELIEAIWDNRFISDAAISSAIKTARKALGDDGSKQVYIKTIQRHGFRFVAEIEKSKIDIIETNHRKISKRLQITILPTVNIDNSTSTEWLANTISTAIITELSRFRNYEIVTQSELVTETNADYCLKSNIWAAEDRVRISVQLIQVNNGRHLWAEQFDEELKEPVDLIDRISRTISATTIGRIEASGHIDALIQNPQELQVEELVLRAQAHYNRVVPEAHEEAIPLLEQALTTYPDHARAHMLLGAIHDLAYWAGWSANPGKSLELALEHGRRAVQLDPTGSSSHAHLGEALLHAGRLDEARSQFEQSQRLNPNDIAARSLHASFLTETGEPELALKIMGTIPTLDPFELNWIPWLRAEAHFAMKNFDAAIDEMQNVTSPINNARAMLAASYSHVERLPDAKRTLDEFLKVAKKEIVDCPTDVEGWRSFFSRESSYHDSDSMDVLMEGLIKAGLKKCCDESK